MFLSASTPIKCLLGQTSRVQRLTFYRRSITVSETFIVSREVNVFINLHAYKLSPGTKSRVQMLTFTEEASQCRKHSPYTERSVSETFTVHRVSVGNIHRTQRGQCRKHSPYTEKSVSETFTVHREVSVESIHRTQRSQCRKHSP